MEAAGGPLSAAGGGAYSGALPEEAAPVLHTDTRLCSQKLAAALGTHLHAEAVSFGEIKDRQLTDTGCFLTGWLTPGPIPAHVAPLSPV